MKKIYVFFLSLMSLGVMSAQNSVTIQFNAQAFDGSSIVPDSISIENISKTWKEFIIYPDSVFTITVTTGLPTHSENSDVIVMPNPFNGITQVKLVSPTVDNVRILLTDIQGHTLCHYNGQLQPGANLFSVSVISPQVYFLVFHTSYGIYNAKLVNNGRGPSYSIDFEGQGNKAIAIKEAKGMSSHDFDLGDTMRYVGYMSSYNAVKSSCVISQPQTKDDTLTLVWDGVPCPKNPTIEDIDGNEYYTVLIGNQCWLRENLKTKHFADGTPIERGLTLSLNNAHWYYPENDANNETSYGLLYNWKAISCEGVQPENPFTCQELQLCPYGWHIPEKSDWEQLVEHIQLQFCYQSDDKPLSVAKCLAADANWQYSNIETAVGNNTSENNLANFAAMPAGFLNLSYTACGDNANFWSGTENVDNKAWGFNLNYNSSEGRFITAKQYSGFSIRCIKDSVEYFTDTTSQVPTVVTSQTVSQLTAISARCSGSVVSDGGSPILASGLCYSTTPTPTLQDTYMLANNENNFSVELSDLNDNTTYYVRAFAINCKGTAYGDVVTFTTVANGQPCPGQITLSDYDGNTYQTVMIGKQCWTRENMNAVHYSNGQAIEMGETFSNQSAYWYYPNNNSGETAVCGRLYNWLATVGEVSANDEFIQGICPTGWHIPSDLEWDELLLYVSTQNSYTCTDDSTAVAKALAFTSGWLTAEENCAIGHASNTNNATNFSAKAAGYYNSLFNGYGQSAIYWSANDISIFSAWTRRMDYNSSTVEKNAVDKYHGLSVRCVRNL